MTSPVTQRPSAEAVRAGVRSRLLRRRRRLVTSVALAAVVVAGLFGFAAYQARLPAPDATGPVPSGADRSGVLLSAGPVRVDVYLDFLCPACRDTEQAVGARLDALAAAGRIQLVHHPMGHLDDYSEPAGYSSRAAAAAGCAADGGRYPEYAAALFARQPAEHGPGLGDAELVRLGRGLGLGTDFEACVTAGRYRDWVAGLTRSAYGRNVAGTPTVLVAGRRIDVAPDRVVADLDLALGRQ